MRRMNFPNRRDQRRADAEARSEAYAKLSDKRKLGKAGAKEQRKIKIRIAKENLQPKSK